MTKIEEAWDAVQDHLKTLAEALREFRTVEVLTLESEFDVVRQVETEEGRPMPKVQLTALAGGNKLRGFVTKIDMLHGDIFQGHTPGLTPDEATRLKAIHDKQVEQGCKIFSDNIAVIATTVGRLARPDS
jgi:hypothetical protein